MTCLGTGKTSYNAAMMVTEYIKRYWEQLCAKRFLYINNDAGEVVSARI